MIRKDPAAPIQAYEVAVAAAEVIEAENDWAGEYGHGVFMPDTRQQAREQFESILNAYIDQRITAAGKEKP